MARLKIWIAGALVTIFVFACAGAAQTHDMDTNQAQGILPSGMGDAIDRDVVKIREATAKFKNTEAAEAAGYKLSNVCIQHQPAGAMGYHAGNEALQDATLDLEHPEVLVYEKMPDGSFKLNGVEFIVPTSAWTSAEPPRIMGQALKKVDRLGIWYLHVWTWDPSPSGLFADWNPNVKCVDASPMQH